MKIHELAKQAGINSPDVNHMATLEKFAELVAAHERDECAKLMFRIDLCGEETKAAKAIRARGTT